MATSKKRQVTANSRVEQVPTEANFDIELGVDQNMPFSAPFNAADIGGKSEREELREQLRNDDGSFGPTVNQLVAMRRMDGQARALYRLLTLPIQSALKTSTIVPAADGEEEADFIEAVFNTPPQSGGMTVSFGAFMEQMLTSLFDGFTAFEKIFWRPNVGPMKGKITLKKLAHRPSETISFITDEVGGFEGLRQRSNIGGKTIDVYIPKQYSFYYAAQEAERKFYGVSFFQSAFYHYDKKAKVYYLSHLAAQRTAVGTRIGTMPQATTAEQRSMFQTGLKNLSFAQYMSLPEGYKVEVLRESGSFDFLAYINHHNSQMSKSILAGFFDKDQGSGESDGMLINFGSPGDGNFILMLRAIMESIADKINHYIIPQLIDYNFKGAKYPKFTWGRLTDEQRSSIAQTFNKLMLAGQQSTVTPEFIRSLEQIMADEFGLEIDYEEIERLEAEQVEQMEAQAAQEAAMLAQGTAPAGPGGSPAGAVPSATPPASGGAPAPTPGGAQPPLGADVTNMTLLEFEQQVMAAVGADDEEEDEDKKKDVALTITTDDYLLELARKMLDEAESWHEE